MRDAFGMVLFGVVAVAIVAAVWAISGAGDLYRQIGRGGLSIGDGADGPARDGGPTHPAVATAERDAEIRQMLEARNARRAARGEPPVDVDVELAALTRPSVDPSLVTEVRQLVEARNARRVRAGKEPLDVEREVERQLRELG